MPPFKLEPEHLALTRTHSAWRQAGEPTIAPVRVDLVVENANIITIDPERPRARSLLGEHIVNVGDGDALDARRRIDLGGLTVVPGFNDTHNHMRPYGESLGQVDLSSPGVSTVQEVVAAIARRVEATQSGAW